MSKCSARWSCHEDKYLPAGAGRNLRSERLRIRRSVPAAQQDRDKYECNSWAVGQSGFDPSAPDVPPHERMQIVDQSPPNGAVVGSAAATAEHDEELNRLKAHADLSEAQTAVMETKASEFRRAIGACLEGRGYSVR